MTIEKCWKCVSSRCPGRLSVEVTSLDPLKINDAKVIVTDVLATNGVVHVIDKVLIPPGFSL